MLLVEGKVHKFGLKLRIEKTKMTAYNMTANAFWKMAKNS